MKMTRKAQRGAALTEFVLSMLLFIPVFLYTVFLDDMLHFRLDQQETAISSTWDYTIQDYQRPLATSSDGNPDPKQKGNNTQVQLFARYSYCDHEGALDSDGSQQVSAQDGKGNSWQTAIDCGTATGSSHDHHKVGLSAHECWLGQGQQVTCSDPDKSIGIPTGTSNFAGQYQQGGMYTCSAKLQIQNTLLPQQFFNDHWSKVNLTKAKYNSTSQAGAHADANGGDKTNSYIMAPTQFALLTDTWALTDHPDIKPGKTGDELQKRTQWSFDNAPLGTGSIYKGLAWAYAGMAISKQLMIVDPSDLTTANVAFSNNIAPNVTVKQDTGSFQYPASEWGTNFQNTANNRGQYYLGCKTAGGGC